MDFESILPLVLAAIYIISRFLKAKPKKDATGKPLVRPQQTSGEPAKRKAFSFEDILKEFEKNLAGDQYEEEQQPMPVEEIQYERPTPVRKEPAPVQNKYQNYQGNAYESPLTSKKIDEVEEGFSRSEKYKLKEDFVNNYINMLRDPDGAKNAIVLSEIINRKYF